MLSGEINYYCKTSICVHGCNYIIQFGDEKETLYFVAYSVIEKNEWMSKLKQGNVYTRTYIIIIIVRKFKA